MGCLAGLLLLSACSSEENMADTGNKIDVAKGIRFQFTEEAFVPGEVAAAKQGTRAMAEPQEIDLGNGIIAEATLEPDTAGYAQTRAGNPVPDGTYKIYAIDAGGTRHDGLTGTMTGGVFTPSGHWELEAGTYTFVCINSAVTDNGNELYVKLNHADGMSLIGVSDPVTVTNPFDVFVSFVMRHPQARIRYQFVSYTEPLVSPILNWLNSDQTFDVGSAYFDLKGNRLRNGGTNAGIFYNSGVLHLNQPYQPSSITKEYTYTTDYILCSPEYNSVTYYAITSNLYGRAVFSNKGVQVGPLQKNHSYIWKLKFKNKDPWYLYNDGTIGSLAKRGSRTPIGIVVKEKTSESDQGTAAGLDILHYPWKNVDDHIEENVHPSPTNMVEAAADMNGYNWTYQPNLQGVVRANQPTTYPGFYQAARYTPGVPTASNIGRWYVPSYGELIQFIHVFDKSFTLTTTEPTQPHYPSASATYADKVKNAFTQVGKPDPNYKFITGSTQINVGGTLGFRPAFIYMMGPSDPRLSTGTFRNVMGVTWPFVHF